MSTLDVVAEVAKERARQDQKWGEQNHADGTGGQMREFAAMAAREWCDQRHKTNDETWLDILNEEICEAFAETDPEKLRQELLQVAAVAVAWIEALDRRTDRGVVVGVQTKFPGIEALADLAFGKITKEEYAKADQLPVVKLVEIKLPRTCNRHFDCNAADREAKERYDEDRKKPYRLQNAYLYPYAEHCNDECCNDCFGD